MSAQIFYLILIGLYKIYVNHFNKLKTFQQPLNLQSALKLFPKSFLLHNSFKNEEKIVKRNDIANY